MTMRRARIIVLLVLAVSLFGRPARAEPALVVLVRPQAESALVNEAITRIRGELIADGFQVSMVDAPAGADPASVLAGADRQTTAAATLGLFLHADAKVAEVWVVDRLTQKTVMRRIETTAPSARVAPEVLARRSVELLRASLLEILVEAEEKPLEEASLRANVSRWVERSFPRPSPSPWGVEAGALFLGGSGRLGSAVMPVGRLRAVFGQRFAGRLSLAGLGTRPEVESDVAKATVSQELGLFELVAEVAPSSFVRPFASLGAGAYHIGVEGSASAPYVGKRGDRFAFAADTGAGLLLSINSTFALSFEAHLTLVTPYPVIRLLDADPVVASNPRASMALAMVVRL
jgi:hypothetical protein